MPQAPSRETLYGIGTDGTNRVAVGANGTILFQSKGKTWTKVPSPNPAAWFKSVAHFKNRFYVIGSSGAIISSPDGEAWQNENSGVGDSLVRVTVANGHLLAMGWDGQLLERDDAGKWQRTIIDTNLSLNALTYGNGLYILGGERIGQGGGAGGGSRGASSAALGTISLDDVPTIYTSRDLKTWIPGPKNFFGFQGAAFGKDTFVLTGSFGQIAYSSDGTNWVSANSGVEFFLEDAIFANGKFYAAGLIGSVLVSSDGKEWSVIPCPSSSFLYRLCATRDSLLAVGHSGTIVEAPFDLYFASAKPGQPFHELYGATRGPLRIESSPNLNSWTTFLAVDNPTNPVTFLPKPGENQFFRARIE